MNTKLYNTSKTIIEKQKKNILILHVIYFVVSWFVTNIQFFNNYFINILCIQGRINNTLCYRKIGLKHY